MAVLVNGDRHAIAVPKEWTGTLQISLSVHRGRVSRKILVGRAVSVYLTEDGGQRSLKRPPGGGEAVGGSVQEANDGEAG